MEKVITVGTDLHDQFLVLRKTIGNKAPIKEKVRNRPNDLANMICRLKDWARKEKCQRIVFVYEASAAGYGLYDMLIAAGIECHILAPTKIKTSAKEKRLKTDDRDALRLLQLARNHVMAGDELPSIWIPSVQIRDDRELVRARLSLGEKVSDVKNQIQCLLKRHRLRRPEDMACNWTQKHLWWLRNLGSGTLGSGGKIALQSFLNQYFMLQDEIKVLDEEIKTLASTEAYAASSKALIAMKGVAILTAMVFLTEMGELSRFANRRQVGAYLGLAPSSNESGEKRDRKGHITKAGSHRVRKVLCQSIWTRIRVDGPGQYEYANIHRGVKGRKKVAVVAMMRRLAILMWHTALNAQEATDLAA